MKEIVYKNWYKKAQTVLDYDQIDELGNPVAADLQDFLADKYIDKDEEQIVQNQGIEQEYQAIPEQNFQQEQFEEDLLEDQREIQDQQQTLQDEEFNLEVEDPWTPPDIDENAPQTGNKVQALRDAIADHRVLEIRYSPAGRENRNVDFGKNIRRVVEPHALYQAGNGNTILTTWDRSVGAIRAFIVDRIQNIIYRDEGPKNPFVPKDYVMPNNERGKIMANSKDSLVKISAELEKKGLNKSAAVVKEVNKVLAQVKEAQYVGVQGQWIRNRRCWDNCYRNKRTTSPNTSAQEVWFECWDEYLASMKDSSKWDKYASIEERDEKSRKPFVRIEKEWNKYFASEVERKRKEGMSLPEAVYDTFDKESERYSDEILKQAGNLTELAVALDSNGNRDLAIKLAEASNEILKEAQFGGGVEGLWNKVRRYNPFSSKSRAKGLAGDISTRLKRITQQALQLSNQFNTIKQLIHESGKSESEYQSQLAQQQQQRQQTVDKLKAAPGKAYNWMKQKGQEFVTNPLAQQGAATFSESETNIKTAQITPAYRAGAEEFAMQLRDQFATYLENLRNESTSMSQMATQTTDPSAKQMASQAAQRIMQFIQTVAPFEQAFRQRSQMVAQADQLVGEMQNFAQDMNSIQMGQFEATSVMDTDQDGVPDNADVDDNNDGVLDTQNTETSVEKAPPTASQSGEIAALSQAIQNDDRATRYFATLQGDKATRAGIAYLMNLFQNNGVEFTPDNWKNVGAILNWNPPQSIYGQENIEGKYLVAKILNKNKGILFK